MQARLIIGFTRITAALPWWLRRAVANLLTQLLWRLPNRRRARAAENISRCLHVSGEDCRRLLYEHLRHRADGLLEMGALWHWPLPGLLRQVSEVHGWEHLQQASAAGHGVLVAVPHFGSWELASLYLGAHLENTALLYKPLADERLDAMLNHYRARAGSRVLAANRPGIATLVKVLRSGGYAGILPDQRPPAGAGRAALLFGREAPTMTLLVRLAGKTGARVVFVACRRLADRQHFAMHIMPAAEAIHAAEDVALDAMNQGIEAIAALDPAQYQWSYNRYRRAGVLRRRRR